MIKVNQVSFSYENTDRGAAIKQVQAEIPKGQVVLLCGESGSGKTTFGRLLNGLIPHYYEGDLKGSVTVNEKNVGQAELYELAPIVGSVFQNPKSQFYTLLTDTEIVFACENLAMEREDILVRFDDTVESLHIEGLLGKSLFNLSGGEKQKIACASVSTQLPALFVLDEPSANLDIGTIGDLREIIRTWKSQGRTIVIAEHRLSWLKDIADRVLYFKDGCIAGDLPGEGFWLKPAAVMHEMGLRASEPFSPEYRLSNSGCEKIRLQNFRFAYNKETVLDIPELEIPEGAVVAVLGNNGAGKTTFSRCLCGLEKRCSGTLTYQGQSYNDKERIGLCYMVMQDVNHQLFCESVLDEVRLGLNEKSEEQRDAAALEILSALDLSDYKDSHPMSLSGGQRQRVAIAGAVASHKEILVFDEPTSGLDYRHMKEVARNIYKLSEMGKTQFIITHDPELTAACCNYVIFLENGKVARYGDWSEENIKFIRDYLI